MATTDSTAEMAEDATADEKARPEDGKGNAKSADEILRENETLKVALKNANNEAAQKRKRLDQLEKEDADRKAAQLSAEERKDAELKKAKDREATLESTLKVERVRFSTESEASKLGFLYPDTAFSLLESEGLSRDIEYDDDGRPDRKSVKAALKKLLDSKPLLAADAEGTPERRPTTPSRGGNLRDADSRGADKRIRDELANSGRYSKM